MRANNFQKKSEDKSRTIRMLHRQQMFEKKRKQNSLSYQKFYDQSTWLLIKASLQSPIPMPLPPLARQTISYYRRDGKKIFKTQMEQNEGLDPHMTFESLWALACKQDIEQYPNFQSIIKQFQDHLSIYLSCNFPQIKEMAIIAAGNKILGKQQDIMKIVVEDPGHLWVLINHIYERKIPFQNLFKFLHEDFVIVFYTIYEMTNVEKDQINEFIVSNQEILNKILSAFWSKNQQTQSFAIKIIANILAEKQDFATILISYNILDGIFPVLKNKNKEIIYQICWLLSNLTCQKNAATPVIYHKIMQRLYSMLKDQTYLKIKIKIYEIVTNLILLADRNAVFTMVKSERILEQCSQDILVDDMNICLGILQLVDKIIELGDDFFDYNDDSGNQFIKEINYSPLRKQIQSKTFYSDDKISNLSFDIIDKLNTDGNDLEDDMI